MEKSVLYEHRSHNSRLVHLYMRSKSEYYSPILEKEKVSEGYEKWQYLRDFEFPEDFDSSLLEKDFIHIKMKGSKCPHHGTNLTSCKPVNGIVQCPQHGLKWNIETKELVL